MCCIYLFITPPQVKNLDVSVNAINTNYMEVHGNILDCSIYIDRANALDELKELEDKLIMLVAEAKDLVIGAC